jgi:hypothetical protein
MAISTIGQNGLNAPLSLTTPNLGTPSAIVLTNATGLARAALPTGSVLQVVSGVTPSSYTTASSSPTATGYGLSITPTSATSKILILLAGAMDTGVANNQAVVAVRRGSTDLGNSSNNFSAANRMIGGLAVIYLDSPATTSSTTYNIYFQAGSSSTITWYSGATVTLMEIAA